MTTRHVWNNTLVMITLLVSASSYAAQSPRTIDVQSPRRGDMIPFSNFQARTIRIHQQNSVEITPVSPAQAAALAAQAEAARALRASVYEVKDQKTTSRCC